LSNAVGFSGGDGEVSVDWQDDAMSDFDRACKESALFTELKEIADSENWSRLDTEAKQHHFVPQLLLRGFAKESGEKVKPLYRLDVHRGTPELTDTWASAARRYFYRVPEVEGVPRNWLEGFFSKVENRAAPLLRTLKSTPGEISAADRATLAFFFALQMQRTPVAAQLIMGVTNSIFHAFIGTRYTNREQFADDYRNILGEASSDTIEEFRRSMIDDLRSGRVSMEDPGGAAFGQGLVIASVQSQVIFDLEWLLLECADGFVTSDRGFAIHDPSPRYPWSSQSLISSPDSETTLSLDRDVCVLLRVGDRTIGRQAISKEDAMAVNLRTYGWADEYIFGPTQQAVVDVRIAAKSSPARVIRQKPLNHVSLIEPDPTDDSLVRENLVRGWPARVSQDGTDYDYVVIPHDKEAAAMQARVAQIVEARTRRKLGIPDDAPLPGGMAVAHVDIDELR
jgi:hypothetical protein